MKYINNPQKALEDINELVYAGNELLLTEYKPKNVVGKFVDKSMFNDWKSVAMGYLICHFGENSELYLDFKRVCTSNFTSSFQNGFNIIKSSKIFLEKSLFANDQDNGDVMRENMKKIFISHSSLDREIVGSLIDLMEAIGISSDLIFCSSFEGYGVKLGENFLARLKKELSSNTLVLFVLSSNFYKSEICLCEMGASWIMTREHIPILIPPLTFDDVEGVIPLTQGLEISSKAKLNSFKKFIIEEFSLKDLDVNVWERKRDTFINKVNSEINKKVNKTNRIKEFFEGDLITHKSYGKGEVITVGEDGVLEIRFEKGGIKKMVTEFASLKKISE